MLYKSDKTTAANIRTSSLPGLGRGTPRSAVKSFAAAGNKIFKNNGEKVKNLSQRVRKHAGS